MQRSIYKHIILDTIAVTGDDISVVNRHLYINGVLLWKFDDVSVATKVANVSSETAGVLTYTPTATPANATTYYVSFTVSNPNAEGAQNDPLIFNVAVNTPATGSLTATTLVTQFKNALANAPYTTYVTASGSSTLVLTATTGYPVIIGNNTPDITVVQTTQGVALAGTVAEMEALGAGDNNTVWASGTAGTFAGTAYDLYYATAFTNIGEQNTTRVNQGTQICLWVNAGATNKSTFETALENVLKGGTKSSATTAYTNTIAVNQ